MAEQKNVLKTPTTSGGKGHGSGSRLESLPTHLLVKIICHLSHDQLNSVSQVSRTHRDAVQLARQFHFNYITPDHSLVRLQRVGHCADPHPGRSGNGWVNFTQTPNEQLASGRGNTPPSRRGNTPPSRRGRKTLRSRLDFTRFHRDPFK